MKQSGSFDLLYSQCSQAVAEVLSWMAWLGPRCRSKRSRLEPYMELDIKKEHGIDISSVDCKKCYMWPWQDAKIADHAWN